MKHLEWDDNDNLQNTEDPSALEDVTNKVEDIQNAYNNISEMLSNIGSNKEGEGNPPSSTENNSYSDNDNESNDTNADIDDGIYNDEDNDLDNDGIDDDKESSPDDDKNGKSAIDKDNDKDSDGKDDSDEANEENENNDEEDEDEDADETDEGASGGGGIVGRIKGSIKAKIAHTILKIKIYLIVFCILFFMFLITTFSSILTPDSLKAVLAYQFEEFSEETAGAWVSFTQTLDEIGDNIVAFFTDLFGGDSDNGISETEAYEIGEYDAYHQYNDSLKSNYTEIETALKQAYKDAKDEAKQFCKDNGYSWWRSNDSLVDTNSDSWEHVYAGSNYGDLLSVVSILLDEEAYESEEGYNPETFDAARFSEFMKDENTIKHLYHISYVAHVDSDASDPSDAKYVSITIWPYDVYDLFLMGTPKVVNSDGSIEDTANGADYTNKEWSEGINNYDFMQTRTDQIEAICNDENYELYKLDNKTEMNAQRASSSLLTTISNNVSLDDVSGTNKKVVYEALKRKGLDDVHIAAVMGNLQVENGFSTAMKGDQGSVGLCQWLNGRKDQLISYADELGLEVTDIMLQAQFLVNKELESQMSGYHVIYTGREMKANEAFFASSDLVTSTDIFCTTFERCYSNKTEAGFKAKYPKSSYAFTEYYPVNTYKNSEPGRYYIHLDKRRSWAQTFYNQIQNGVYADTEAE